MVSCLAFLLVYLILMKFAKKSSRKRCGFIVILAFLLVEVIFWWNFPKISIIWGCSFIITGQSPPFCQNDVRRSPAPSALGNTPVATGGTYDELCVPFIGRRGWQHLGNACHTYIDRKRRWWFPTKGITNAFFDRCRCGMRCPNVVTRAFL